jgi:Xaa-Pro aminopeptidase
MLEEPLRKEYEIKHGRLQTIMDARGVDAIWLTANANIAWLSGGQRSYIDLSSERGIASLLITRSGRYVLTDTIEADRLRNEEGFKDWEIRADPWYAPKMAVADLTQGLRVGVDGPRNALAEEDVSQEVIRARAPLTEGEIDRYRQLGRDAGAALATAARALRPGMTESEVAARMAAETYKIGAVPVVVLVAGDERCYTVRHALPIQGRSIQQMAMLVLCARRSGLIANLTRIIYFGRPPEALTARLRTVSEILASLLGATRPGVHTPELFGQLTQLYAQHGFAGEWRAHHQGGACSYGSRDWFLTPDVDEWVRAPQAQCARGHSRRNRAGDRPGGGGANLVTRLAHRGIRRGRSAGPVVRPAFDRGLTPTAACSSCMP